MAILDCLNGLVGIKGRAGDSGAQQFIQSLPGISVLDFEKAINNESRNAYARIDELITLAINNVSQDVQTAIMGEYELKTFIENDVIGYFWENQVLQTGVNNSLVGIQVRCVLSPYMKLFLRRLRLMVNFTGNVNVQVWDLIQNKMLEDIDVTSVDGEIAEVLPDWEFATNKQRLDLFIGYSSAFSSYKTLITAYKDDDYVSPWLNSWMYVRGCSITNGERKIWQNCNGHTTTAGISFDYSLQCSFDERLCNIKKLLAMPILYKVGALIAEEMRVSRRLNGVVTAYVEDYKVLEEKYTADYNRLMKQLMVNMSMPKDLCFSCASPVESRMVLP